MKRTIIITAAVAFVGFLAIQTVNAGPGRTFGPGGRGFRSYECAGPAFGGAYGGLTDEQIAQRREYCNKVSELRNEFSKDVIDGDRITALRNELAQMRTEMGWPECRGDRYFGGWW